MRRVTLEVRIGSLGLGLFGILIVLVPVVFIVLSMTGLLLPVRAFFPLKALATSLQVTGG